MDLFPGTKLGIGPAIDDGFYYDFELPRPLTPTTSQRSRRGWRRAWRPTTRSSAPSCDPADGPAQFVERGQPYKVEILDDLAARAEAAGEPCRRSSTYEHGSFRTCARARTSSGPAGSGRSSCSAWPGPTGGATRSGRCSSGSTARSGRARRSSTSTCGAAPRRRSAITAGSVESSTCSASTPSRRPPRSGIHGEWCSGAPWRPGRARCAAKAASTRSGRPPSCTRSCGRRPVTGPSTRTTCSSSRTATTCPASSR